MILVVGSANLDFVIRTPVIPAAGETVLGRDYRAFPGGKGANQAVACARAGAVPTAMALALGEDGFAAVLESSLREAGVTPHIMRTNKRSTGVAFICVSEDAENAIVVCAGANDVLSPDVLPPLDDFTHVLLQLETPLSTVTEVARAAKEKGLQVVLNAAPAQPLPAELLALLDVLIVNELELQVVAGKTGSVESLLRHIDVPLVVVTLGGKGCQARHGDRLLAQPGFVVPVVDTTAAGDTFCGVLTATLAAGGSVDEGLKAANAAAALACTRHGAQPSIPTQAELRAFLAQPQRLV